MKTLLPEGRINLKRLFLKKFKISELRIFRSNLFHSITAEGKNEFLQKVMFYFELKNVTPCVISNHNNIKKIFWRMNFINFIEAA